MSKTVTIEVNEAHIERGLRADPDFCPIAFAMRDAGLIEPSVYFLGFRCGPYPPDRVREKHEMPESAKRFIELFDAGFTPKPVTFAVEVPDEAVAPSSLLQQRGDV